jgi:hypothetical protein
MIASVIGKFDLRLVFAAEAAREASRMISRS